MVSPRTVAARSVCGPGVRRRQSGRRAARRSPSRGAGVRPHGDARRRVARQVPRPPGRRAPLAARARPRGVEERACRCLEEHGKKLTPLGQGRNALQRVRRGGGRRPGHLPAASAGALARAAGQRAVRLAAERRGAKAGLARRGDRRSRPKQLANAGELVVAVFKNPDRTTPRAHRHRAAQRRRRRARSRPRGRRSRRRASRTIASTDLATGFDHHPARGRRRPRRREVLRAPGRRQEAGGRVMRELTGSGCEDCRMNASVSEPSIC